VSELDAESEFGVAKPPGHVGERKFHFNQPNK
jgi:hypothetical protein